MSEHMTERVRTARVRHACQTRDNDYCTRWIEPGEQYVDAVVFPGHLANGSDQPLRWRECRLCALYYGRWPS